MKRHRRIGLGSFYWKDIMLEKRFLSLCSNKFSVVSISSYLIKNKANKKYTNVRIRQQDSGFVFISHFLANPLNLKAFLSTTASCRKRKVILLFLLIQDFTLERFAFLLNIFIFMIVVPFEPIDHNQSSCKLFACHVRYMHAFVSSRFMSV